MHIVIAFISAVASLLYALNRFGVDIGGLNPWAWNRRRKWKMQYNANPAFNVSTPMEAMTLLITATAKIDGDISSEEKMELLSIFENDFNQTPHEASALLRSSMFLLSENRDVYTSPEKVLEGTLQEFTMSQKKSSIKLLQQISTIGGAATVTQDEFIDRISSQFFPQEQPSTWS